MVGFINSRTTTHDFRRWQNSQSEINGIDYARDNFILDTSRIGRNSSIRAGNIVWIRVV